MKVIVALALLSTVGVVIGAERQNPLAKPVAGAAAAPPPQLDLVETRRKAESGDAKAQLAYADQCVAVQKFSVAEHWYRAAGVQGEVAALYALAEMYRGNSGSGTNQVRGNPTNSVTLHKLAAALGHTKSHFQVGMAYKAGAATRKDPVRAYAHLKLSENPSREQHLKQLITDMPQAQIDAAEKIVAEFKPAKFEEAFADLVFETIQITGIFGSADQRMAMLNGRPVPAGQRLDLNVGGLKAQVKLAEITSDGVFVSYGALERKITPRRL